LFAELGSGVGAWGFGYPHPVGQLALDMVWAEIVVAACVGIYGSWPLSKNGRRSGIRRNAHNEQ
jgi:hypothetical protein